MEREGYKYIMRCPVQAEFQKTPSSNESIRTDREYFTKMLLNGKLQRGIAPDH